LLTGAQQLSHSLDVLLLLPVLLHCVAISAGKVDALVGFGPATAAAHWRASWAAAAGSSGSSSGGVTGGVIGYAGSSSSGGGVAGVSLGGVTPVDLHKLAVRAAAGYMFAAALLGQAVRWLAVVSAVAGLMLAGRQAVEAWHRLHGWWCVLLVGRGGLAAAAAATGRPQKQKGT
jgi:hypothetical protein